MGLCLPRLILGLMAIGVSALAASVIDPLAFEVLFWTFAGSLVIAAAWWCCHLAGISPLALVMPARRDTEARHDTREQPIVQEH